MLADFKYTNKNSKPIPQYKKGDEAWFLGNVYTDITPFKCLITKVNCVKWVEYRDTSGWSIEYNYKPSFCERSKMVTINEEELYPTEKDALIAAFNFYKERVYSKLADFKEQALRLGLKKQFLIENK